MKAITVENLSKVYSVATVNSEGMSFREMLIDQARSLFKKSQKQELFHALKDVSFEVEQGEVLGIIGKNGSGKSTLLKILSKITAPTSGRAIVRGRVASLLEVGTGFHAELSGRENIFMSGIILGMKRWEINQYFDEIVSFAGVEQFLDMPVKKYSSGMRLRLAFSVAAHLQPEILLVDEVLAVGDYEFEKKCLKVMEGISNAGRTILFVSHNMDTVKRLCSRAILLKNGSIEDAGAVAQVIDNHLGIDLRQAYAVSWKDNNKMSSAFIDILDISVIGHGIAESGCIHNDESFVVEISYTIKTNNSRILLFLLFHNDQNILLFATTEADIISYEKRSPGVYVSQCVVPGNIFKKGMIYISLNAVNAGTEDRLLDSNLILSLNRVLSVQIEDKGTKRLGSIWGDYGIVKPAIVWKVANT